MDNGPANRRPSDKFYVLNCGLDWIGFAFRQLGGDVDGVRAGLDWIDRGRRRQRLRESLPDQYADNMRMRSGFTTTAEGVELAWLEVTGELLPPRTVSFAETMGRYAMQNEGLSIGEAPTLNRVDLATDVYFDDPSDAQLVLRAFSSMLVPRHKIYVIHGFGSGAIETVAWHSSSGIQLRIYDKTAESGGSKDLPGTIVRIERQIRRRYRDQWTVPKFYEQDLSRESIAPLKLGDHQRVVASDFRGIDAELRERRDRGEVTDAVSEGLLGALVRAWAVGPSGWVNPRTVQRRYKQLADAGIAVDPDLTERVDLGIVLAAVQAEWEKFGRSAEV